MSTKRKLPTKLGQPMVKQPVKSFGKNHLDESKTVVSAGGNATKSRTNGVSKNAVVEISSDSESGSENGEEENEEEDSEAEENGNGNISTEREVTADVAMEDADMEEAGGEPSFGDLVRAHASEPIDVAAAFEDPSAQSLTYPRGSQLQAPSGASLGTVLTQALKTNDASLLESCLQTTDLNTIRATIQRLDSPLAGVLLQKLAERLHRRPGRAGSLMVWVQWSMVTHGGYLATQRGLISKLAEVNKVIDERSKALQHLLSLKGKLDMLEAQIELRRGMQNRRRMDSEDDEEGVIYVEGQESEDEKQIVVNGEFEGVSDSEMEDEMLNGVIADSDEEEEDSDDDGDLIDDEAEETDNDSGDDDEEEVNHDDVDDLGDEDESDDAVAQGPPPSKMQRLGGGAFSKRR